MASDLSPAEILKRDRDAAQRLVQGVGQQKTQALLRRAQQQLQQRLKTAAGLSGPGKESFTFHQLRATLAQVKAVTAHLQVGMQGVVLEQGQKAADQAAALATRYLKIAEQHFTGSTERLNLDSARMMDRAVAGTESSILSRLLHGPDQKKGHGILARYGQNVVDHFEDHLQQRLIQRTPWAEVRQQLTDSSPFLQQAPAHWAERIVRTECLIGSTPVSGAVVTAAHRRWYEGPVVEIVTEGGRQFTTTPNHPMLTRRAWLGAGQLQPGDYLVCDDGQQTHRAPGYEHVTASPATIGEVYDSLTAVAVAERRRTTRPDFHGDCSDGYVDTLCSDRPLVVGCFAAIYQPLAEKIFTPSDFARAGFCLACGRLLSAQKSHCFCVGSNAHTLRTQVSVDCIAAETEFFRNLLDAHAALVAADYPARDLDLPGVSMQRQVFEPRLASCSFDRVLSVRVNLFSGHVFNLSTPYGYFNIAGAVTGNTMHAEGRAANQAIGEANQQLGDMCKILSSTFDSRTGSDSYAVHGEIRRPSEEFQSWFGSFSHPPDRPNDRGIVVPHRISWPIPAELKPKGMGAVASRWSAEGRKGSPPPSPLMTTIPLEQFGKPPPPLPGQPPDAQPPGDVAPPLARPVDRRVAPQPPGDLRSRWPEQSPELFAPPPVPFSPIATQVSPQAGSNPGGVFQGTDDVQRYVKFYKDPAQAVGEQLANSLYGDLGIQPKLNSLTFEHEGKLAYASELLPNTTTLGKKLDALVVNPKARAKLAKKALEGFAADVLMANWDAVGLNLDNMLVGSDGSVTRIDNGAAFLTRAQGARKSLHQLNDPTEWTSFFDPSKNPAYSKLAKLAGVSGPADLAPSIKSSVKKILQVRDAAGGWAKYVDARAAGISVSDKQAMVEMLDKRTTFLEQASSLASKAAASAKAAKPKKNAPLGGSGAPISDAEVKAGASTYRKKLDPATSFLRAHPHLDELQKYTGSSYRQINRSLAGLHEGATPAEIGQRLLTAERINTVLATAKAAGHQVEGTVLRGFKGSPATVKAFTEQDNHTLAGFTSTTTSERVARNFAGSDHPVFLRIRQRSAIPIDTVSRCQGEQEALLPAGTKIRILRRWTEVRDGRTWLNVDAEEL